jgi:hypothetical protein
MFFLTSLFQASKTFVPSLQKLSVKKHSSLFRQIESGETKKFNNTDKLSQSFKIFFILLSPRKSKLHCFFRQQAFIRLVKHLFLVLKNFQFKNTLAYFGESRVAKKSLMT